MRFLITAGPTREPIDPVRYLCNRSSGKMGYALAEAALASGHEVTLVSGPVHLTAPYEANTIPVETALEMYDAVARAIGDADVAIFCAAVSDYRVADSSERKIKKSGGPLSLTLIENPDILGSARDVFGYRGILVGFAAETNDVIENAASKLSRKGCDLLVANDVSRSDIGFGQDDNEVTVISREGTVEKWAFASKRAIANRLIARIEELAGSKIG